MHSRLPICRHTKCETQKGARQLKLNYLPYWGKVNGDFQQLQRKRWWFLGNENGVKELAKVHFDSAWFLGWCPLHSSCEWRPKHLAILWTRNLHRQPLFVHLRGKMGASVRVWDQKPWASRWTHWTHPTFNILRSTWRWSWPVDAFGLWNPWRIARDLLMQRQRHRRETTAFVWKKSIDFRSESILTKEILPPH